jgi:hypothetical protein
LDKLLNKKAKEKGKEKKREKSQWPGTCPGSHALARNVSQAHVHKATRHYCLDHAWLADGLLAHVVPLGPAAMRPGNRDSVMIGIDAIDR